jgi:pimeloyl-ACP methyl ester carboxylesterase/tetratricopeptide (TPR) repeat protein
MEPIEERRSRFACSDVVRESEAFFGIAEWGLPPPVGEAAETTLPTELPTEDTSLRTKQIILAGALALAMSEAASPQEPHHAHAGPWASMDLRMQRVRVGTGVELELVEAGPADGIPILFLHGYTDSWYSFAPVLDRLPPGVRAIALTQRGHGHSERPSCCYGFPDLAADAVALLDALGIPRAAVVGHSMGSFVAQRIAIDHPHRVSHLVLIGSGYTYRTEAVSGFYTEVVSALEDPVPPELIEEFQVSTTARPLPPAFLATVIAESGKLPARVWREVLRQQLDADARDELDAITAPTWVISGELDDFFPPSGARVLARRVEGARQTVYEGTGHAVHWEEPDRFVQDLQAFIGSAGASANRESAHGHEHESPPGRPASSGPMPLLPQLGDWGHRVTTGSEQAQKFFDQGLRLVYAFNHDEAVRSFEEAARLDGACAMCYWGIAYALGPNINLPMSEAAEGRAAAAVGVAERLAERSASPVERAYIDALAARYGEPGGEERASRDSAYAAVMRAVAKAHPTDVDAQVIYADAMMNLRPWDQWTRDGEPQPGTDEVLRALEAALDLEPDHAGACHLYVHAVEASPAPERALPCAERLPRLMPGAGHVVHMPAHVYLRMGRYADAARANIAAVETDARYFGLRDVPDGIYPMFYAPHNLHFLWATYTLLGERARAMEAAAALVDRVSVEDARVEPSLQGFLIAPILTLVRFEDWQAVLDEPAPSEGLEFATGMWRYARGMARVGTGELGEARGELEHLRAAERDVPEDQVIILNSAGDLLTLAAEVLAAWIDSAQGRHDAAIRRLREAIRLEDGLTYDEPPPWYHSTRNQLGEALVVAGRTAEAERAFRDDLAEVRENGWSLRGLERALRDQGRSEEADAVAERLARAWTQGGAPAPKGG